MTEEIRDTCKQVLKGGLEMIEGIEELTSQHEGEVVEDEMADVIRLMLNNANSPMRKRRIIALTSTLGQNLGSERLDKLSAQLLNEWQG